MIFSNSIKSIVRSKGKTVLFTILIFSLTLALAICVSVWAGIEMFLKECDEFYTTVGVFEYIGTEYPNDTIYDSYMDETLDGFDEDIITNHPSVLMWDSSRRSLGYIDGFWRTDQYMPQRMLSVVIVGNVSDSKDEFYTAIVMKVGYSLLIEEETVIHIDKDFGPLESNHYYMLFGEAYYARTPIINFARTDYENAIANELGLSIPYKVDITKDNNGFTTFEIPEDSVLNDLSQTLKVIGNSTIVCSTKDISSIYSFNQNELYILEGRVFNEEEYENSEKVCIISQLMAQRLNVGISDKINLSVSTSNHPKLDESYWASTGFDKSDEYEIVGITNATGDMFWYVYVPWSENMPYSSYPIGYTIGQAVIENGQGAQFYKDIEPLLKDRVRLTVYDQGYSSVEVPYTTLLNVVKILTAVFVLVELAVVVFFGYLFVYRQKETAETMFMLGSGNTRVFSYFLFSSGFIALAACSFAMVGGRLLSGLIMSAVRKIAEYFSLIDFRFSNANLSISKTLEFNPDIGWDIFIMVSATVLISCVISCLVFLTLGFLNKSGKTKKIVGPKKEKKSMNNPSKSAKYAFLSILRGGPRTAVVPMLALTVVLFFGQLSVVMQSSNERIEYIYNNNVVEGYFTDYKGKQIAKQNISAYNIANLQHSGYIEDLCMTVSEPSYYVGAVIKDGKISDIEPLYVPSNAFVMESLQAQISRGPNITFTNNIEKSPEFYYVDSIDIDYVEGYDESVFSAFESEETSICLVTQSYMKEHNLSYGDVIRVAVDNRINSLKYNGRIFQHYDLKIIGSYVKHGDKDTIYAPLSENFNTSAILLKADISDNQDDFDNIQTITPQQKKYLLDVNLNSVTFKIINTKSLSEFKDFSGVYGFSQVNRISTIREFMVLKDAILNSSLANVEQQIRYLNIAYPILYVLIAVVAYAVSYLMVVSRKKEFATMTGLGAEKKKVFMSFFTEQTLLCFIGTLAGIVIWYILFNQLSLMHLVLTAGFILFYLLGSAVSIKIMGKMDVLTIMSDRD
jgi:ABC-type lipoprotein release transport system permease subunit